MRKEEFEKKFNVNEKKWDFDAGFHGYHNVRKAIKKLYKKHKGNLYSTNSGPCGVDIDNISLCVLTPEEAEKELQEEKSAALKAGQTYEDIADIDLDELGYELITHDLYEVILAQL